MPCEPSRNGLQPVGGRSWRSVLPGAPGRPEAVGGQVGGKLIASACYAEALMQSGLPSPQSRFSLSDVAFAATTSKLDKDL